MRDVPCSNHAIFVLLMSPIQTVLSALLQDMLFFEEAPVQKLNLSWDSRRIHMSKYGQYCPVAKALEILGDRWTLLIVRDMLSGTRHFNDLERGLPRISRALLASRLRQLQQAGIIEKRQNGSGRQTTEYLLTQAGQELINVVG